MPTIGGNYCAVGELPPDGAGMEPMWTRLLNPALLMRNIMTPGPADQVESPELLHVARCPGASSPTVTDVLVYETDAARRARSR